jgi:hypothetical protein
MSKIYKVAPLPFQGQKRRFVGAFAQVLSEAREKQEVRIIVDLFGGSGLLSHTAKRILPECRVIYNDFDNYSQRLRNIKRTNRLLADIRLLVTGKPDGIRLDPDCKSGIIKRIHLEEQTGFVDYITLSSSLLFSAKYVTNLTALSTESFYNNVKTVDYDCNPDEYLQGLEIVHCDYKELYLRYKDVHGVLFVIDPPYLSTDTSTYHSDKYWKLRDYLDVLKVLVGTNYIFFSSDKSSLVELCHWFADNRDIGNPFANSVLRTHHVTLNKTAGYNDMMLYKFSK